MTIIGSQIQFGLESVSGYIFGFGPGSDRKSWLNYSSEPDRHCWSYLFTSNES